MSPALLALQHIACEPPAAFEDEARAHGLDLVRVELDGGEKAPDWREFDGLIVMGGAMGACEDEAHSWLTAEKRAIAEAARSGTRSGSLPGSAAARLGARRARLSGP